LPFYGTKRLDAAEEISCWKPNSSYCLVKASLCSFVSHLISSYAYMSWDPARVLCVCQFLSGHCSLSGLCRQIQVVNRADNESR